MFGVQKDITFDTMKLEKYATERRKAPVNEEVRNVMLDINVGEGYIELDTD